MALDVRKRMATKALELVMKERVDILWSDGSKQTGLHATVIFDRENEIPEDSDDLAIKETVISLIKSQLDKELLPGVQLTVTYPIDMTDQTITKTDLVTIDKAMLDGQTIGFVNIYPKRTSQSA